MGKITGFKEIDRQDRDYESVDERILHWKEFTKPISHEDIKKQASRCMDCGIPFCHTPPGCPADNQIPDWNDLVYNNRWKEASENLHSTNNFPEFTGRVCPAPCEQACTLNLINSPVTIKNIECAIADKAWSEGWISPEISKKKTKKRIAIIGSGPAGLACAQQLARAGHNVSVYEKNRHYGGLLRYGIPDFKMEKQLIQKRISQMMSEGVEFRCNAHVGSEQYPFDKFYKKYDAIVLAIGSEQQRTIDIPGKNGNGIYDAMSFLIQQNKRNSDEIIKEQEILASGKKVMILGGGDTGSDCIGTAIRQGAISVSNLTYHTTPPQSENKLLTWPYWPVKLWSSTSHEEGCDRLWALKTKEFILDKNNDLQGILVSKLEWKDIKNKIYGEIPNSDFVIECDMALLAIGFEGITKFNFIDDFGINLTKKQTIYTKSESYKTNIEKIFTAGDSRRGASLVVWAIKEGRQCAREVDEFLMGHSDLSY